MRPVAKRASASDATLQKTVADNVRQARLALGISQRALARACDISQRHLSQIELQGSNIRLMTLVNLAQHLNTTPARLLTPSAGYKSTPAIACDGSCRSRPAASCDLSMRR